MLGFEDKSVEMNKYVHSVLEQKGWVRREASIYTHSGKKYGLGIMEVPANDVMEVCRHGGIKWTAKLGDPANYIVAIPKDSSNLSTQMLYLNLVRTKGMADTEGIVPNKTQIAIKSGGMSGYTRYPMIVDVRGPLLGLGLVNLQKESNAIENLSTYKTLEEIIDNPVLDGTMDTISSAQSTYHNIVRKMEQVGDQQQILHFSRNRESARDQNQADFLYGSVSATAGDGRQILIKPLALGVESSTIVIDGVPSIAYRRYTPYLQSGRRAHDERPLQLIETSVSSLGHDVKEIIESMREEMSGQHNKCFGDVEDASEKIEMVPMETVYKAPENAAPSTLYA